MKLKYTGQFEVSLEFTPENIQWVKNQLEEAMKENDEEIVSKAFSCLKDGFEYGSKEHIKEFIKCAFNLYFIENILEFNSDVLSGFKGMEVPYLGNFRSELKEEAEDK